MQFTPQTTSRVIAPVVEEFSRSDFEELLRQNPGKVVLKFGATWCGPCKTIEPLVNQWFSKMPETVRCATIDIDESFDLYGALKVKRQINGIPAILCFNKGNVSYIPDMTVVGANVDQVNAFFRQVLG
jgi:thiol-disulfide isomerase/thioredoxin